MTKLNFREAQIGSYEVLKFLDQLCRENHWQYFLMYGSLIGAVRNHGIIPWDDDIDIMMPRPDYEKLIHYCKSEGAGMYPFKLFEHSLEPSYPHPIARMSDMRYKVEFDNEKDYGIGLFVDIYPLDGVGNNRRKARKLVRKSYHNASLCFLTSRKKFGIDNTTSVFRLIAKIPAYLWANIAGNEHYIKKAERLCLQNPYEDSKYVSCVAQPFREKNNEDRNIYEKDWFKPIEITFENGFFYIPQEYDIVLHMSYGDYMTPLPEDQRQTHHTYDTYKLKD